MKLARHPDERRFQIGIRMDRVTRTKLKAKMVNPQKRANQYKQVEAWIKFLRDENEKVVQKVGWWLHLYYPLADVASGTNFKGERYFAFFDEALRDEIYNSLSSPEFEPEAKPRALAEWKFFKEDAPAG